MTCCWCGVIIFFRRTRRS